MTYLVVYESKRGQKVESFPTESAAMALWVLLTGIGLEAKVERTVEEN